MSRIFAAGLTSFLLIVPAAAQQAEEVVPEFGWEPGLTFEATAVKTRSRSGPGVTPTESTSTLSYGVAVSEEGERLRVRWVEPGLSVGSTPVDTADAEQGKVLERVSELMPDFLVSRAGVFAGLVDLETHQEEVRSFLREALADELDAGAIERIESTVLTEEYFNSRLAQEWNAIVGTWAGGEYELGTTYEMSQKEPIPLVPGEEVLMSYIISATKSLSCERGGVTRRCVELTLDSSVDREDMERVTRTLMARLTDDAPQILAQLESFDNRTSLRVVTEVDGMIPHEYELERTITGSTMVDGERQAFSQVDGMKVRYDHD